MKVNVPLVSIIIVNFNGLKFLPRLLQSIYSQTLQDFEIIMVDNGSSDESINYVSSNHKDVKVIQYENRGYGSACNRGAKEAVGKYLFFLNEDMYLPEDFTEKMVNCFKQKVSDSIKIGGLSCRMVGFEIDPSNSHIAGGNKVDLFGFAYPEYVWSDKNFFILSGSPFFTQRETFLDVGGFEEYIFLYGEDAELSWRYNILGYKLYVNNDTYIHHYGGGVTGFPGPKWIARTLSSQLLLMFTCYSFPMLLLILPLYLLYITLILLFLLIRSNFNKEIIKELLSRLSYMAENIKGIWKFRTEVQKKRVISDWKILKYISPIPAFLYKKSWKRVKTK